jgi:hypothetical protein
VFLVDGLLAGVEDHPTIDDILDHLRAPAP